METIRVLEKTGKDGTLNLRIPLGKPDVECEVVATRTGTRRERKRCKENGAGGHDVEPEGACLCPVDPLLAFGFRRGVENFEREEVG
jgi:hypothetical protein